MNVHNVLVVYKKSVYQIYVLERRNPSLLRQLRLDETFWKLRAAHEAHQKALREIQKVLRKSQIPHRIIHRARKFDYRPYDFVISVGGDGTFLEAARGVRNQVILGVNSDPDRSVGSFCSTNQNTFEKVFDSILCGRASIVKLDRMQLKLNGDPLDFNVLNDILISHPNPAAMSRYRIRIGRLGEEQRSSGLWISTAAGSTGAMKSAGGKVLPLGSNKIQYLPRELYWGRGANYRLKGGVLSGETTIKAESLMRVGMIYVDGAHFRISFSYGDRLEVSRSSYPLKSVKQPKV